jgi:hypothetical protein
VPTALNVEDVISLCSDCPMVGYPGDKTRCLPCPRRQQEMLNSAPPIQCDCFSCASQRSGPFPGLTEANARMVLCPECGNKRCPRATHHDNACTGSNEPGQPGSRYQ